MTTIIQKKDASAWSGSNPILADGEPGYEADTMRLKVGDGVTPWNNLPYGWFVKSIDDGSVYLRSSSTAPNPALTPAYVDSSGTTPTLKVFNKNTQVFEAVGYAEAPSPAGAASDSLAAQALYELKLFLNWLNAHGLKGCIGEFGIPWTRFQDTARWDRVVSAYLDQVMTGPASCWAIQWQCGAPFDVTSAYLMDQPTDFQKWGPSLHPTGTARGLEARRNYSENGSNGLGITIANGYVRGGPVSAVEGTANAHSVSNTNEYCSYGFNQPFPADGASFTYGPGTSTPPEYNYGYPEMYEMLGKRLGRGSIVRLVFLMERMFSGSSDGGVINAVEVGRIKQAIGWAKANGLKVQLACINNGARSYGANSITQFLGSNWTYATIIDQWTKIAAAFVGTPGLNSYELMGEPGAVTYAGVSGWRATQQSIINAIRSSAAGAPNDQTTTIVVSCSGNSGQGAYNVYASDTLFTDPANLVRYDMHHYWDGGAGRYAMTYDAQLTVSEYTNGFGPVDPRDQGQYEYVNAGGQSPALTADAAVHDMPAPFNSMVLYNTHGRGGYIEFDLALSVGGSGSPIILLQEIANGVDTPIARSWYIPGGILANLHKLVNVGRVGTTNRTFKLQYYVPTTATLKINCRADLGAATSGTEAVVHVLSR